MDSFRVSRGGRRENRFPSVRAWRSAWRIQPAELAVSPRLPHAGGNNSLRFEYREGFEATGWRREWDSNPIGFFPERSRLCTLGRLRIENSRALAS